MPLPLPLDTLSLVLGLAIGGVVAWLVVRQQASKTIDRVRAELAGERAVLVERCDAADRQRAELVVELRERDGQIADLQDRLTEISAARSAAEARADRVPDLERQLAETQRELTGHRAVRAELEVAIVKEREAAAEKLALLDQAQQKLADAFKALSAEALSSNNKSFLELAKTSLASFQEAARGDLDKRQQAIAELLSPVRESLAKVDGKIGELEKAREGAYQGLKEQVASLLESQKDLRSETANLVKALRSPIVRGRWGEIQLRRVVEMAGMLDHCDFYEQSSAEGEDGRLRPDLLVRLPGEKNIVVDAKAPLAAFLEAVEAADDGERRTRLREHAAQVRTHMRKLGQKSYWDQFQPAPEFVVLFLPGETFFSAALEHDPALIEAGVNERVILATPTTLIALLRAVAYGWRQESLAQNARMIGDLGRDLYKRLHDMTGHLSRLGRSLGQAVGSFNQAVGSFEHRVLVSARRLKDLDAAPAGLDIEDLAELDHTPRELRGIEAPPKVESPSAEVVILPSGPKS